MLDNHTQEHACVWTNLNATYFKACLKAVQHSGHWKAAAAPLPLILASILVNLLLEHISALKTSKCTFL